MGDAPRLTDRDLNELVGIVDGGRGDIPFRQEVIICLHELIERRAQSEGQAKVVEGVIEEERGLGDMLMASIDQGLSLKRTLAEVGALLSRIIVSKRFSIKSETGRELERLKWEIDAIKSSNAAREVAEKIKALSVRQPKGAR